VKGERRYRYYLSRSLIKGTPGSTGRGWRLPAPEIERSVAAAAREMLNDQAAIATAAQAIGLAENRLPSMFSVAEEWRQRLQSEVEAGVALTMLVQRVDLTDSGIQLALKVPIVDGGVQPVVNPAELIIRRDVPIQIRRRGVEMRLVIKAIARPRHEPIWHC
jgi:site-specific DNA recombinase